MRLTRLRNSWIQAVRFTHENQSLVLNEGNAGNPSEHILANPIPISNDQNAPTRFSMEPINDGQPEPPQFIARNFFMFFNGLRLLWGSEFQENDPIQILPDGEIQDGCLEIGFSLIRVSNTEGSWIVTTADFC